MRLLLLSDIHSNLEALEACLREAPSSDAIVHLGDIVGYGASPNEVSSRVRELGGTYVRGNHDKVVSGLEAIETFNPVAGLAALWNREHLAPDLLSWLRELPQGPVTVPALEDAWFVHGAPDDEDRYVISIEDSLPTLMNSARRVTFFGHTHIQGLFARHSDFAENVYPEYPSLGNPDVWELFLQPGFSYMINPGSVGQPRDGDWRSAFAVYDTESSKVTFFRVPYNVRGAQERIFGANLPARLATRLAAGR
ncbi:MAG: metallophosphoesterase family protein [Acidobacteria bacterium]|nr:metallophosphoesterase family protein [Acidobacteriota bacterium]